ncbi:MAG: hypothetical protein HC858_12590 [Brachymonas sp.]|nr:hypothetical protein [Brachymonas sp.]
MSFHRFDAKRVAFDRLQWVQGRANLKLTADPGCVLGGMALDLQKSNRLIQMPYQ